MRVYVTRSLALEHFKKSGDLYSGVVSYLENSVSQDIDTYELVEVCEEYLGQEEAKLVMGELYQHVRVHDGRSEDELSEESIEWIQFPNKDDEDWQHGDMIEF